MEQKPKYFFAAFGPEHSLEHPVSGGVYPHSSERYLSGISRGDVMLLYCTKGYLGHDMEAPGVGVVTRVLKAKAVVHYQYSPLDRPVDWTVLKGAVFELEGCTNFGFKGNWLRQICGDSFRNAIACRRIDWP